ncbi:adhesion G-protein coupled receptor G2 isoform X5 [Labeo rohita]|uniref:adhesion G-protein coupled receptor G2 isoform X5 n=1 Tax=Labeo rohita TaxID=84645 RepID=UPI0021E2CC95|nr:adhesion G-protein coupled receptor G2 isoform X5 [Labeo rohita]
MSCQKQNLLWLMIVSCALCQITRLNKLKISISLTDRCFQEPSNLTVPDLALICQTFDDINNFHIMNVKLNISSQGQCKTYSFKLTVQGQKKEIRMKEMVTDINRTFLLKTKKCEQLTRNSDPTCKNLWGSGKGRTCLEIPLVDPRKKCRGTTYDDDICKESKGNSYVLRFINSKWMCVTCHTNVTLKPHEVIYNMSVQDDGDVDLSEASEYMNKMESKMEEMTKYNISKAGIIMGDAIGVLHLQAKNTKTKDICYSSDEDIINNEFQSEKFTVLNNEVYGITMRANITNLTDNIEMIFTKNHQVGEPSCVSWDGKGDLNWTTYGCETEINDNTIKCSCSHLTFFAVLMIPQTDANETLPHLESLTLITSIGCGISMFFLSIALFMHFLLRKAKSNQATKILMNMFVSLCLLNAAFLSNESVANTQDNTACVFIALVLHYSMLASFTWFFIQALHMYLWLIRQNVTITNYVRKITVLGWVFPTPIVIAIASVGEYKTLILKTSSEKISRMCWITNPYIHYIVNIGYYALVFIFTTGIFIIIVTKVVQARIIRATDGKRKTFRKQLMMVLSLFLLFGLTWSVMFFSYGAMIIPSYYIFTVLNSFQGFFLFLYYYHIHNGVAGHFSDDPENTDSNTIISQSSINAVYENIHN